MKNQNEQHYDIKERTLVSSKQRILVDKETGEEFPAVSINKLRYGAKQFWKCFLLDFLRAVSVINSREFDIVIYVIEHTNQNTNQFIGTYDEIATALNCSKTTITNLFKKLQGSGLIKKGKMRGVWMINPNLIMKGNDKKRHLLLSIYDECDKIKIAPEEVTERVRNVDETVDLTDTTDEYYSEIDDPTTSYDAPCIKQHIAEEYTTSENCRIVKLDKLIDQSTGEISAEIYGKLASM